MKRSSRGGAPRRSGAARAAAGGLSAAAALAVGSVAAAAMLGRKARRAERAAATHLYDPAGVFAGANGCGPKADALVVLGAAARALGPSGELRARLDHAAVLWRDGVAPRVLVSGGVADGIDEIDVMAGYLRGRGLPGDAVAPVRPSQNTRVLLRSLAQSDGHRYVAVSSPYHALRIATEARRQGLRMAVSAPPRTPETLDRRVHRVRLLSEVFAVCWYALPPAWTARVRTGPGTLRHIVPDVLAGRRSGKAFLARCPWRRS